MTERSTQSSDISLRRWTGAFIRYSWLLVLGAIVGGIVAWLLSSSRPIEYLATTKILVQEGDGSARTAGDISLSRQLASTYETLITTRPVLSAAGQRLGMSAEAISARIAVSVVQQTQVITISARDESAVRSAEIANEVAAAFIDSTRNSRLAEIAQFQQAALAQGLGDIAALTSAQLGGLNSLRVIELAEAPNDPVSSDGSLDIYLGGAAGLAIAVGIALLAEYVFFDVVRSKERFEEMFAPPVLTVLPRDEVDSGIFDQEAIGRAFKEGVRFLRTNLQFVPRNGEANQILFTSAEPEAGKSTVLSHLGYALTVSGKSVVIIDGDLRRPSIGNSLLGYRDLPGLSNFLSDDAIDIGDITVESQLAGLSVIPSGPIPPNPSELLSRPRMRELLDRASGIADYVLVDSPPTLAVADAPIIAGQVGNVLLVIDSARTRARAVRHSIESIERVNGRIIGAIINKYKVPRFASYYGHYYGNYYGDYYSLDLNGTSNGAYAGSTSANGIRSRLKRLGRGSERSRTD